MPDSGQLRSSISLPRYHVDFFTFAEHLSFEHSTGSPWPVIYSGREGNINKQTNKTQKFLHTRSSIRQSASPCSCLCSGAPRPVRDLALAPRLSVATESTGTVLTPSQMSEIAGHVLLKIALQETICKKFNVFHHCVSLAPHVEHCFRLGTSPCFVHIGRTVIHIEKEKNM